ncbi:MAG: type II CAAX endopeptidase family protein [Candidatus Izemoplasmatales bacterium]
MTSTFGTATVWSGWLEDATLALIAYVLLYLLYYFASDFRIMKKWRSRFGERDGELERSVYLRRTMGFVLLGLVPALLVAVAFDRPLVDYGLSVPEGPYAWLWFLAPSVLLIAGSFARPAGKIDVSYYPEVRKPDWTRSRHVKNGFFWVLYLVGYEFGLRGMVFFSSLEAFGLWPAVVLNSVIYSLIHIFKGPGEAFGAFFLGVLFCLVAYFTGSLWIPLFIHAAMAIINDVKAVAAGKVRAHRP